MMDVSKIFLLTCSHMSIAADTVLLISCRAKLIFIASCAKYFMYLPITLCSRWYSTLWLSIAYIMPAHLAAPLIRCPFTTTPSQIFVTSCLRKRLGVDLRRWGGSNTAAISWSWNLNKVSSKTMNCYTALTLMAPTSNTEATTIGPALWQASRTSIKKITWVSPLVFPWIKSKGTGSFYFVPRPWGMKTRVWYAIFLVQAWLPRSSKPPIQWIFWLTSHQTWDNTPELYQTLPVHCPWVY